MKDFASVESAGPAVSSGGGASVSSGAASSSTGAASSAVADGYAAAVKSHVDAIVKAGEAVGNATTLNGCKSVEECFRFTVALLKAMDTFKRPKDIAFCTTETRIQEMIAANEAAGKKDMKSNLNLMKVFSEGLGLFLWQTTPGNDMLEDFLVEMESQVLFFGNKIRTNGKEPEKAVFEAFVLMMRAHVEYLKPLKETICTWRGKQDGEQAKAFFEAQMSGGGSPAPEEEKKQAPAPKPAAKPAPTKAAAAGAKKPVAPPKKVR